jgi:hypothetical protein
MAAAAILVAVHGVETRGRRLEELVEGSPAEAGTRFG